MTLSKYTFLFDVEGKEYYCYNTLSNALLEIDEETYDLLQSNKSLSATDLDDDLWEALRANNILTDSDEDDFLKYKAAIARLRNQRTSMHLTLAPTMDCCFRCHYCFEKYKEPKYMTPEVMDAIVKYVASCSELEHIKITWFGGEPLMAIPQIEAFYDKFSSKWTKSLASNIITTGYHIDHEAVRVLKKVGVSAVQITLDGLRETHNKVKHLPGGEDAFERVIANIELLNDLAPEINVMIRVNLTLENAHEYVELCKLFSERFSERKNIGIAPAFVLDRGTSGCDDCKKEGLLFGHKARSEYILDLTRRGVDSPFIRYPEQFFNECAALSATMWPSRSIPKAMPTSAGRRSATRSTPSGN